MRTRRGKLKTRAVSKLLTGTIVECEPKRMDSAKNNSKIGTCSRSVLSCFLHKLQTEFSNSSNEDGASTFINHSRMTAGGNINGAWS